MIDHDSEAGSWADALRAPTWEQCGDTFANRPVRASLAGAGDGVATTARPIIFAGGSLPVVRSSHGWGV
jgi:hypothetical protein